MCCVKCRIEVGRCIYGCPFTEIYIQGAVGSEEPGVTIWTEKQYEGYAETIRKQLYLQMVKAVVLPT